MGHFLIGHLTIDDVYFTLPRRKKFNQQNRITMGGIMIFGLSGFSSVVVRCELKWGPGEAALILCRGWQSRVSARQTAHQLE